MPDCEQVIYDIERCICHVPDACRDCSHYEEPVEIDCVDRLLAEALELLKEQEPIEPTINEYGEAYCICGENVGIIPSSKNLPSIRSKYCSECGRRMKWNG